MPRPQRKFTEEQIEEINSAIKASKNSIEHRKLLILKARAEKSLTTTQLSKAFGISLSTVSHTMCEYLRHGISSTENKCGGNRRNLSIEVEDDLLQTFSKQAEKGQMLVVSEIKKLYEQRLGREVPKSTIYAVLARKNWRKIMPRSKHPNKASDEAIEAYKKNQ